MKKIMVIMAAVAVVFLIVGATVKATEFLLWVARLLLIGPRCCSSSAVPTAAASPDENTQLKLRENGRQSDEQVQSHLE